MACELSKKRCVPCQGGVPPLKGDELRGLAAQLGGGWLVVDEHRKPVGPLRFFVVPINETQLSIADQPIDLSDLKSGTLIQISSEKMKWGAWLWLSVWN